MFWVKGLGFRVLGIVPPSLYTLAPKTTAASRHSGGLGCIKGVCRALQGSAHVVYQGFDKSCPQIYTLADIELGDLG